MAKKLIVCFPLEIKKREFYPKLYLAYLLLKTNKIDIIFGDKKKFYIDFEKSKNLIFFYKGGGTHLINLFQSVNKNNYLFNLDEEGPLSLLSKADIDLKISKDLDKYISKSILWGKEDIKKFKKKKIFNTKKFMVLGHPKLDLLNKPYINLFHKEYEAIRKKYKNFVFISSHYTTDNVIKDRNYFFYIENLYSLEKEIIEKNLRSEVKKFSDFINLVKTSAKQNPKKLFIFRPHPGQDIKKVIKRFGELPKNLKIIFKYTVTPWIMACSQYVHSGCTTVFEAAKLKKNIIYISNFDSHDYYWLKIGKVFKINEKVNFSNNLKRNTQNYNTRDFRFIEELVENITQKKSFGKNFLKMLKKEKFMNLNSELFIRNYNLKNNFIKKIFSYLKKTFLQINFIARILSYFYPDIVITKEMKDSKFDRVSKIEIQKNLKIFSKIDRSKNSFKVTNLNNHIFRISKLK